MRSSNLVIEQVLNKILDSDNTDFINSRGLTEEYFPGYEDEFYFVLDHYEKYKKIPDKITFADEFPDFNFFNVTETDDYLYQMLYDFRSYNYFADAWETVREDIVERPVEAIENFRQVLENCPKCISSLGQDIIAQAIERLQLITARSTSEKSFHIKTGFDELDAIIKGWARGEELVVVFGRTGQGKSFILIKTLAAAFKMGNKVGLISPEMSPEKVGYRFDTLTNHFSNTGLTSADIYSDPVEFDKYTKYIEELSTNNNKFVVASMQDFNKKITVSKLRNFILQNELDILGIDGITYLQDERYQRGDSKHVQLTQISEDLMTLSCELQIPIIVAAQSNRAGVRTEEEDGAPEIENIKDSDGISHNCTKIISIRQHRDRLDLAVKKHRDGKDGQTISYYWDPDFGTFEFTSLEQDSNSYRATNTDSNNSKTAKGKPEARHHYGNVEAADDAKEQRKKRVRDF